MNIKRLLILGALLPAPALWGFTISSHRTTSQPPSASTFTAITISPDNDYVDDGQIVTCLTPNPYWELQVSTHPTIFDDTTIIRRVCGQCSGSEASWDGRDEKRQIVPNGAYYVRANDGGGVNTLQVNVLTAFLKGSVSDGVAPVADVEVNAWGPNGGKARTDANGQFYIGGLVGGQAYTLNFAKLGLLEQQFSWTASTTSAGDVGTVTMPPAAIIRIHGQRQLGGGAVDDQEVRAGLNVHTANYSKSASGTLHFPFESADSDNGYPSGSVNYSTWTSVNVASGTSFTIDLFINNYGNFSRTVTSPASGAFLDVVFDSTEIIKKANVSGTVTLPAPSSSGQWVSVEGLKAGEFYPTAFGGGYINPLSSSATYTLYGVSTGTWLFKARAEGFRVSTITVSVPSVSDVTNQDFPIFNAGGGFGGTITVTGDTTGLDTATGNQVADGFFQIFLNAGSPSTFQHVHKEVSLPVNASVSSGTYAMTGLDDGVFELHTFLPGFQLNPPGYQQATVSGGTGNKDISFLALSGQLDLDVTGAAGTVVVDLQPQYGGPESFGVSVTTDTFPISLPGLGTGLYRLHLVNNVTGLEKSLPVAVTNGQTTGPITVGMGDTTYSLSGEVTFSDPVYLASFSSTVTTPSELQALVPAAPRVEVYAFPLPENFNGGVQPLRSVTATPVGSSATFTAGGLVPGTYLVRVMDDLNPPTPPCAGCQAPPGLSDLATSERVVTITTVSLSGVDLQIGKGVSVTGNIFRPDASTDSVDLDITLRRKDGLVVWMTSGTMTGASFSSTFTHVSPGDYFLEARPRDVPSIYTSVPELVTVGAQDDISTDVKFVLAGAIVGTLRDADSNTLINALNVNQFLPNNFNIYARANPWVPGGHQDAHRGSGGGGTGAFVSFISTATGQFAIYRLIPGAVYDVAIRGFQGLDPSSLSQGQKAYSPISISGIRVEEGQPTVDLGTIDLSQGVSVSGSVGDTAGGPLANVRVVAYPSQLDGGSRHDQAVETFTDDAGKFVLQGINRDVRYYDIIAAPRFDGESIFNQLSGLKYGEERLLNVDVSVLANRQNVNFTLVQAEGVLSGSVLTEDGGPLLYPFGDRGRTFREQKAAITLHLEGSVNASENPLGEIDERTDIQGNFQISGLKPGIYTMRAVSVGYSTYKKSVVVKSGANSAGTITLKKGAKLEGGITKRDNSFPSAQEVKMVVGVDDAFSEFIFGAVTSNEGTNEVTGYKMDGFRTGLKYTLMAIGDDDGDIVRMSTVSFSLSTETKTLDLVYKPSPPSVFVTQGRSGDTYNIRFFSTHKLQKLAAADDLTAIVSCVSCAGSINFSSSSVNPSRDTVEVVYNGTPSESSFQLGLTFTSAKVNAETTGSNFVYGPSTFTFYAGIDKSRIVRIANTIGGECSLEGSAAGGEFPAGTFDVDSSSSVDVGVQSTTSSAVGAQFFTSPSLAGRASALGVGDAARKLGQAAYPSQAVYRAAMAAPDVSQQVFSNFYNIFLPAGVSHTLKKDALITLKYSDSITDPSSLNVYYFDQNNGVYLLEDSQRAVDEENKTITVAVRHLSTFVLLNANAPVITGDAYAGTTVEAHNFPNPFNLKPRTVTLNRASSSPTQTITGTMIRVAVPSGKSGTLRVEIYDSAGGLVRELTDTVTGGTFAYKNWDGTNDAGKKVASGVYIARVTIDGGDEKIFKMAVVK